MNLLEVVLWLQTILIICHCSSTVDAFSLVSPLRSNNPLLTTTVERVKSIQGRNFLSVPTSTVLNESEADSTSSASNNQNSISDTFSVLQTFINDVQLGTKSETIFYALKDNLKDGEIGTRGEIYFVLQLVLVICILFGTVPFSDFISFILGPFAIILGGSVATLGVLELGVNLTPWPSPPKDGSLITDGFVFNQIRHPIYAGLIYLMFGVSMWSGSAMRVLLCVALWYLLDFKSELEEGQLVNKFGTDYISYKERVTGKFIPQKLTGGIKDALKVKGKTDL